MRRKPLIPCPWHGGWHNSRLAVRLCKRMVEPSQRCSACRARVRRNAWSNSPDCAFHQRYPDLEQDDWITARRTGVDDKASLVIE